MDKDDIAKRHVTGFARSFIVPARAERYESKLLSRKHRRKILDRLDHYLIKDLDERYLASGSRTWPKEVVNCYVIASEKEYDGQLVSAIDAKDILETAYFGIVISFIPGKLACYKDESPSDTIWLERT